MVVTATKSKGFNPLSLDAINFLLADVRGALGPYLNVFLVTQQHWSQSQVGVVTTISGLLGLIVQTPIGGNAYSFADWPNLAVSTFGAGVYTIWHNDGRFIYVGMSGRGITAETSRPRERTPEWGPVLRLCSRPACPADFISG
jgi:hypothetical protein